MALTFVNNVEASEDTLDATIAATLGSVVAGNLIVLLVKWETDGSEALSSIAETGGSSTWVLGATNRGTSNDFGIAIAYTLSSVPSGSVTYTATLNATADFKKLHVWQFNPNGGTVTVDQSSITAHAESASPASGAITTTGTDEVVFCGMGANSSATWASPTIGGVAATANQLGGDTTPATSFARILTATMSSGTGAASIASGFWAASIISFKNGAAGVSIPIAAGAITLAGLTPTRSVFDPLANDARIVILKA